MGYLISLLAIETGIGHHVLEDTDPRYLLTTLQILADRAPKGGE